MQKKTQNKINNLLILKMYWNRASSHVGVFLSMFNFMSLSYLVLNTIKMAHWWLLGGCFIFLISIMFVIGYLDIKHEIYNKEVSLNNKYNPEIQKIMKKK